MKLFNLKNGLYAFHNGVVKNLSMQFVCSHLRFAGIYQRPSMKQSFLKYSDNFKDQITQNNLCNSEWSIIRQNLIEKEKHINTSNIDAVILSCCNESQYLPVAKSYMKFLKDEGIQPNVATFGRLLRIYYLAYVEEKHLDHDCIDDILRICTDIRNEHSLLDITTCENLIHGLVATDRWKDSMELLEMTKLTSTPTVTAYCVIIVKAFKVGDLTIGWKLLTEMVNNHKQPKCEVFLAYLKHISIQEDRFNKHLEELLEFIAKHNLVISKIVADCMEETLKTMNNKVSNTKITHHGKCVNCGKSMKNVEISYEDFDKLKTSFLQKVLIRKDVFQKSSPKEVEEFIKFVDNTKPYDCVIDGLNVAYSRGPKQSPKNLAKSLLSVVRYFEKRNKYVLVLGREHMLKWPKESMSYIYKNSKIFFTNDLTHDDPFLLYATLVSGQSTDFFSRDFMRSHAFLLGTDLKEIFRKWQQQHQYSLITETNDGKLIIKEPTRYALNAQNVDTTWHIPYKENYSSNPVENFELPKSWLCVQLKT